MKIARAKDTRDVDVKGETKKVVIICLQFPEQATDDLLNPFKLAFSVPDWKENYMLICPTDEMRRYVIRMFYLRNFKVRKEDKKFYAYFPKDYFSNLPEYNLRMIKMKKDYDPKRPFIEQADIS